MSWHFTLEKISQMVPILRDAVARDRAPIDLFCLYPGRESSDARDCTDADGGRPLAVGGRFTGREELVTLEAGVRIPADWAGRTVFAYIDLIDDDGETHHGIEALVYVNGEPVQSIDRYHHALRLTESAKAGDLFELTIVAYLGLGDNWGKRRSAPVEAWLRRAELQAIDRTTEALFYDVSTALDSVRVVDSSSVAYHKIVRALDGTVDLLDMRQGAKSESFYGSVVEAHAHLRANLYDKLHNEPDLTPTVWAVGHAHIDTAWLWRIRHTKQKIARTGTTACEMMTQFPEYRFTCSQPQQYEYLKENYPEVFERVKAAIANGTWEPIGGMWVESDCNLPSGESLVRQFLYGQRYFQREFGKSPSVVWLPDVFGYSAAFPQIIKKAGMKYFMTIKIFWNQVNKPPYQTFDWEGIDGTSVLTHFSPLGDYNAHMTPAQVHKTWADYNQKNLNDSVLYIYGYGDGGGGPTREMLETATRLKDMPGMPKLRLSTAQEFFEHLDGEVSGKRELPRWVGELYLEYHRGTYTSQAAVKRANRKAEFLLQAGEQVSVLANLLTGAAYPVDRITKAWEVTLLNQFHDIIPGSSIHEVYEDAAVDYAEIFDIAQGVLDNSLTSMTTAGSGVVVYNPLSWTRTDVAEVPRVDGVGGQNAVTLDGDAVTLIELPSIPSLGYQTIAAGAPVDDGTLSISTSRIENRFFTITLNDNAEIVSLIDKRTGREVIDAGSYCRGNAFLSFEDRPMNWNAWDIDIYYQDKMTPVQSVTSVEVVETGPIRASLEIVRNFGRGSTIRQRISVYRNVDRIDFDTDVDWQERETLLKVAFPVNVRSSVATYDIQFGNVTRPTHWNTSWDWARFESCAHKWADLSEGDYGVSVLSDCKYGWDIRDNVMRLTLLRGPISPDPEADLGRHRFAYSLFPHQGDWRAAGTVRRAYEFNAGVRAQLGTVREGLPQTSSLLSVDRPNLIVETVKQAEDSNALIVRLFECYGQRGQGRIDFGQSFRSIEEVNLLEVESDETSGRRIDFDGAACSFDYLPYEIITFKVNR